MNTQDLIRAYVREKVGGRPDVYIRRAASRFEDELVIQDKRNSGYYVVLVLESKYAPGELLYFLTEAATRYRLAAQHYELTGSWPTTTPVAATHP